MVGTRGCVVLGLLVPDASRALDDGSCLYNQWCDNHRSSYLVTQDDTSSLYTQKALQRMISKEQQELQVGRLSIR